MLDSTVTGVLKGATAPLESTQSTETTTFSLSISTEDLTKDERTESVKIVDDETVASTGENRNGNTVFDWKMYVAVVATLVLILWIGTVFYKCRKKRRKKRDISQIVNQEENNPPLEPIEESVNEEHELGEYDEAEYPYNTIDESQMIDMSAERNVYLEVIDKSSSSGSTASCGKDSEGYLNPYSGLMTTMDGHTYDGNNEDIYNATEYDDATSTPILFINRKEDANSDAISEFSEVESSGDSSSKIDGVDYLNPYTGIVASLDIHVYTRNIEKNPISDRKSDKDDYYLRSIKFEPNHTKVLSETNLQNIFTNESPTGKYCKSLSNLHQST